MQDPAKSSTADGSSWPVVTPGDDGIRPAGPTDECLYCRRKIGRRHGRDCVTVSKKVRVRYLIEVDVLVPHSWTEENILFHRNEGSWCASNILSELAELDKEEGCLCDRLATEFVGLVDEGPLIVAPTTPEESSDD